MISLPTPKEAMVIALQHRLKQSECLPNEQRNQLQQHSIEALLKHALNTVPYYQNHPAIKAMNGNIQWENFPILTRAELQKNEKELISSEPPAEHGQHFDFRSSGSTGRPIHTQSTEHAQVYWQALTLRDHLWAGRNMNGALAAIKFLPNNKARYPGEKNNQWGTQSAALGFRAPASLLNSSESVDVQYRWLCEQQPAYLVTYPSVLQELARIQLREKKLNSIHNVACIGENLPPSLRDLVNQAFGCRVHDIYSSQEVGYMALQCPHHDHYHVQLENCLLEILDDNNQPCPPGQIGRVIVTTLHNYLMPLIRYEIGDYAIPGAHCDCGITLPVLQRIIGRTRNLVTYPNGKKSWPAYNPMALMELFPMARFQLEQLSTSELQLNIQTPTIPSEDNCEKARQIICDAIGHDFHIRICQVEQLTRSPGGKFEEFISRI
jgi:phenylacetate-CoA ligase